MTEPSSDTTRLPPIGFWSYSRQDEDLTGGELSRLHTRIRKALQQQFGRTKIEIFQDVSALPHGTKWEEEIGRAISNSTFLIPILTPNFLQSPWCCREVSLFLEREKQLFEQYPDLPKTSRIFPILFIDTHEVDLVDRKVYDELQRRQFFDYRELRYDDSLNESRAIAAFSASLRDLLLVKVKRPPTPGEIAAREAEARLKRKREEQAKLKAERRAKEKREQQEKELRAAEAAQKDREREAEERALRERRRLEEERRVAKEAREQSKREKQEEREKNRKQRAAQFRLIMKRLDKELPIMIGIFILIGVVLIFIGFLTGAISMTVRDANTQSVVFETPDTVTTGVEGSLNDSGTSTSDTGEIELQTDSPSPQQAEEVMPPSSGNKEPQLTSSQARREKTEAEAQATDKDIEAYNAAISQLEQEVSDLDKGVSQLKKVRGTPIKVEPKSEVDEERLDKIEDAATKPKG